MAFQQLRVRDKRDRVQTSRFAKAFFGISVVAVLAVTLLDGATPATAEWRSVNVVPGETIAGQWHNLSRSTGLLNIAGNVVLFSPVAYFLRLGWRCNSLIVMALCAGMSLAIELVQHQTGRSADIDDLILNTVGALLGLLAALCVEHWSSRRVRTPS